MSKRVIAALAADIKEYITPNAIVQTLVPYLLAVTSDDDDLPDDTMVHPTYSVGELREVGGFWDVDWLLRDIVNVQVTSMAAGICGPHVFAYLDDTTDLLTLIRAPEAAIAVAIPRIAEAMRAAVGKVPIYHVAVENLLARTKEAEREILTELNASADPLEAGMGQYMTGPRTLQ